MLESFRHVLALLAVVLDKGQVAALAYVLEENRILRGRLARPVRFTDVERRRLARLARAVSRKDLHSLATLVTPDTLLRWYRTLVAAKYVGASRSQPRKRGIEPETQATILRLAEENRSWGYRRIVGELAKLGLPVSKSTVERVLRRHGLDPAPDRSRSRTWAEFIDAQRSQLVAADFFSVEALTPRGVARYLVFFALRLKSREVRLLGVRADPTPTWVAERTAEAAHGPDPFLAPGAILIHDRDPLYLGPFQAELARAGVTDLVLPPSSPNLNAYAERFIRSVREECLNHLVIVGEGHLRRVLAEYESHYNAERPHQGVGNRPLLGGDVEPPEIGKICREVRLGGLLSHYRRRAA